MTRLTGSASTGSTGNRPRFIAVFTALGLATALLPAVASAQPARSPAAKPPPTAGSPCQTKDRVVTEASGQQWTCTKRGSSLIWKLTKPLPLDVGAQPIPKDGVWFTNPGYPKDLPPPGWRGPQGTGEAPWFRFNWDITTAVPVGRSCPANNRPLTAYATDIARLASITPQGFVQPGSHATPVPHMYYQTGEPTGTPVTGQRSERVPVYAVADMTLRGVATNYEEYEGVRRLEYILSFSVCGTIWIFHAHLGEVAAKIRNAMKDTAPKREPQTCTGDACTTFYYLGIAFKAGDQIGVSSGWSGGFDVGLTDMSKPAPNRLDAGRWSPRWAASRCHIDYYADATKRTALTELLSGPTCGQLASEKKGTAAGVWFQGEVPSTSEDFHLSLVRDTATVADWVMSVGTETGIPGLGGGVYSFAPAASGPNNRTFDKVLLNTTACYDTLALRGGNPEWPMPTVYLRVTKVDGDTERVTIWADETGADCTSQAPPAGAKTFERNTNTP